MSPRIAVKVWGRPATLPEEANSSRKVLVVGDTVDTRELPHLHLKSAGYAVMLAAGGGEGLCRAKADGPDLIITGITMPDLDGYDMIRELRAADRFAVTPIIAPTAYGEEQLEKARGAGADRAVGKPMNPEELVNLVNSLLNLP